MTGKIYRRNNYKFMSDDSHYFIIVTLITDDTIFYRAWDGTNHFDNEIPKDVFYRYFEEI